ncbi:MotE family protein [Ferrovibrio sp.]|uniref:MotE family protein n=1 Tax=Ferrovibrio sp. TaxID=1917215 RepID=UPI003D2BC2E8
MADRFEDNPRRHRQGIPPAAAAAYAAVGRSAPKPAPAVALAAPGQNNSVRPVSRALTSRVRLLPLTILAVALLLGLKVGSLWQGRDALFVPAAVAQAQQQAPAQGQAQGQTQGQAQAQAQGQQRPAGGAAPAPAGGAAAQNSGVASLADRDPTTFTRAEIELLGNLAQRREQLEQRSRELDLRESLLAAAEKRIDERIAELKKLEASIKQVVQSTDKQEDENLRGLVKIYETMKPEEAARIFAELDANVLLNVIERMKEAKVAAVMAKMEPAMAQSLTVRMATRKQLPANLRAAANDQPAAGQARPAQAPAAQANPAQRPGG